jgi:putative drug exporter of the RND superfamily
MRHSLSSATPETGSPPRTPEPPAPPGRAPYTERIAGWSARHRKTAVLGWLALTAAAFIGGQQLGTKDLPSYDAGQAGQAEKTLHRLGVTQPVQERVLIAERPGQPGTYRTNQDMQRATAEVTAALAALPHAAIRITGPGPGARAAGTGLVSADGRSALVTFTVPGSTSQVDDAVVPALQAVARVQAAHPGLRIAEAGDASEDRAASALISKDFRKAEVTSVPITLILLLGVFGALIAAGIPLLLAGTAVMTAISLLAIPSHWLPVGDSTSEVVLILGMAVGVDYSLFYLRREREERARGASTAQALRIAARTSGRAIVVSGLTVMTALAGLFLSGYDVFSGVAVGTIVVVGVAVLGSLTALPALLSWLGPWADRARIPWLGKRRTAARPSRLWAALVRRVVRRPAAWAAIAAIGLLAVAAPALGMRIGQPPNGGFPASLPVARTANQIAAAFPGRPSPAQIVVTGHDLGRPAVTSAVAALRGKATSQGPLRRPVTATAVADGRGLLITVPLAGSGDDRVTHEALSVLRTSVLPATLGRVSGIDYGVTGEPAANQDDRAALRARTPLVLAAAALLAFVLLLIAFRSAGVALISVGLNMLSAVAGFGLITWIFQDGHLEGLIGFTSYGAIVPWVPLFLFVFLFGLSMDYHVFILSRVREHRRAGATMKDALVSGIASSAGVVTSAAAIMVAVFSILGSLSVIPLQMLGVGLAAAVLIDATVIRGVLLPAALALLGERTWRPARSGGPAGPAAPARPAGQAIAADTAGLSGELTAGPAG